MLSPVGCATPSDGWKKTLWIIRNATTYIDEISDALCRDELRRDGGGVARMQIRFTESGGCSDTGKGGSAALD